MQDRFKFRVWDKINKIWVKKFFIDERGFVEGFYNPQQAMNRRLALMQCTGLKDKNGELVYFDDLVKLDDGIVCIVKQIEDINDIEYGRVVAIPVFCLGKKYKTQYIPTVIAEGEKVGNFYENPELLESEVE